MDLGGFSVSLSVRDLSASRAFYEAPGLSVVGGYADRGWLILRGRTGTIGLFQGMFEGNILTFNPGWDAAGQPTAEFTDIREIQSRLAAAGIRPDRAADPAGTGPDHVILKDPDGNAILLDQHRPAP